MRKYESIELYGQEDTLYWESIEDFKKFSEEVTIRVEEELAKYKNATFKTLALSSGSYSEWGEYYTYVSIELDFEMDMTQEEIDEDNNRYNLKKEQESLAQELRAKGFNGNLAYDKSFVKACKDGLITINREKIDDIQWDI